MRLDAGNNERAVEVTGDIPRCAGTLAGHPYRRHGDMDEETRDERWNVSSLPGTWGAMRQERSL